MMMMIESKNVGWMMMAANAAAAAVWTGDDDDDDVDDSSSSWCFFLSSHTKQCNKCIPNVLVVVVSRRTPASLSLFYLYTCRGHNWGIKFSICRVARMFPSLVRFPGARFLPCDTSVTGWDIR